MKETLSTVFGQTFQTNKSRSTDEAALERLLTEQFAPVAPRKSYVNDLGKRLSDQSQPIIVEGHGRGDEFGLWQLILLITVGVISGILLVLLGTRFLSSFFNSQQTSSSRKRSTNIQFIK